ncbi:hypothetical protein NOVOSPHI9U_420344 [Novosphingobium sp. 9U]|nr:hypothetical protein NOVOSPHI9U_420344 [Novosphingobium sp. 9U]
MQEQASLLLVTHVHVRQGANGLQIDDQTAAGIEQWCRHFDMVTFYGILTEGASSSAWVDTNTGLMGERATIRALPNGYGAAAMARAWRGVRRELRQAIAAHRHLCFTLGMVIGDWPFVAALEAIRQKRRYSAWIDRVEAPILRQLAQGWRRRAMVEAIVPVGHWGIRHALQHSTWRCCRAATRSKLTPVSPPIRTARTTSTQVPTSRSPPPWSRRSRRGRATERPSTSSILAAPRP